MDGVWAAVSLTAAESGQRGQRCRGGPHKHCVSRRQTLPATSVELTFLAAYVIAQRIGSSSPKPDGDKRGSLAGCGAQAKHLHEHLASSRPAANRAAARPAAWRLCLPAQPPGSLRAQSPSGTYSRWVVLLAVWPTDS
mmetsp:Transcript_97995/g.253442  ORF Transcript_97995/g.253442 Transcript_97995/m.253442 type:complete len:138 (+) Transcript_97995:410-823(+)